MCFLRLSVRVWVFVYVNIKAQTHACMLFLLGIFKIHNIFRAKFKKCPIMAAFRSLKNILS